MSTNPVLQAIKSGSAPRMAKLAAAKGMLPLAPEEMIEALAALATDEDGEVSSAAGSSLSSFNATKLRPIVENPEASADVMGFLASWSQFPRELFQPLIFHPQMPDDALASLATKSTSGEVVEIIALKQQSLIRTPSIIDAILANPARTPEADRRAREVRAEFFEKEYGAQFVADEKRAQGEVVEEEVVQALAPIVEEPVTYYDDLSQFIEADLIDTGDALFEQFERDFGPVENMVGLVEDSVDIEMLMFDDTFKESVGEAGEGERVSVLAKITQMNVKERIRFALKGTREVRMILIRDPNRPVCTAVIQNPRITDAEVEAISNLKGIHEEVLRLIGSNRAWTRNYAVVLNLVKNPKTPVPTSMNFLNRLQNRDIRELSKSKNVPEVIRQMAGRLAAKRTSG